MGLGVEPVAGKLPVVEIDAVVVVAGAALAMPAVVVRAPVVTTGFIVDVAAAVPPAVVVSATVVIDGKDEESESGAVVVGAGEEACGRPEQLRNASRQAVFAQVTQASALESAAHLTRQFCTMQKDCCPAQSAQSALSELFR